MCMATTNKIYIAFYITISSLTKQREYFLGYFLLVYTTQAE